MQVTNENFSSLVAEQKPLPDLEEELHKQLDPAKGGTIHVILADSKHCTRTSISTFGPLPKGLWANPGCLSKLITGATYLTTFGGAESSMNARVVELLDVAAPQWFSDVTVRDLLNHTHGIDQPVSFAPPRTSRGTIDATALLAGMAAMPIAPPGQMYSYSSVGSWLLAAIIENKLGRSYMDVAREVFPGVFPVAQANEVFCPALGGPLKINIEQLLCAFMRATSHSSALAQRKIRLGPAFVQEYPGWHPWERGICAGWKAYNLGWFGHLSMTSWTRMTMRISPSDDRGIVVCSSGVPPLKVFAGVFSESLTGGLNVMRFKPQYQWERPSVNQLTGTYMHSRGRMVISRDSTGLRLEVQYTHRNPDPKAPPPAHSAYLEPMSPTIYRTVPALVRQNLFQIEFVRDKAGVISHIWNMGFLWKKQDA